VTDPMPPAPAPTQQPAAGAPVPAPPGTDYPGKILGIVGLILVFFTTIIGLIVSAIALNQSKRAGYKNTPAKVGVILGIISVVLAVVALIVVFAVVLPGIASQCAELGPGVHEVNGVTYTCS
jgi:hypothetical protein